MGKYAIEIVRNIKDIGHAKVYSIPMTDKSNYHGIVKSSNFIGTPTECIDYIRNDESLDKVECFGGLESTKEWNSDRSWN